MTVSNQLYTLESADLVRLAQTRPDVEYLFRHALVQDAAYGVLLLTERQRLHQAVGRTLECRYPDRPAELAPILGHHFTLAGDNERAFHYFTLAGDVAKRTHALPEAIAHYSRALQVQTANTPSPQLIHLYKNRGQAYYTLTRWQEAWDNYQELEQLGRQSQDRTLELWGLLEQVTMRATFNPFFDPQEAQRLGSRALALAEEIGDQTAQASILWSLMRVQAMPGGSSDLAIRYGEQSLALARRLELSEQVAYTLNDLQYAYRANGRIEDALAALAEARTFWQANDRPHILTDNLNQTAGIHFALGNMGLCHDLLTQAIEMSAASNNLIQSRLANHSFGILATEQGDANQALADWQKAADVPFWGPAFDWIAKVVLYQYYGLFDQAFALLDLIRDTITSDPIEQITIGQLIGAYGARLSLQQGNVAEAEALLQTAAPPTSPDFARSQLFVIGGSSFFLIPAELLLAHGDLEAAVVALESVLAFLRPLRANRFLTDALLLQGEANLTLGRHQEAHNALAEALTLAEGMNQRRTLWRIYAALGRLEQQRDALPAAERFMNQASRTIRYIADHAPADLRASFLAMPEVKEILRSAKLPAEFSA
jgi:tetratricopeptide (TPR) repeat protein